jgi:hypothetical protein
MASAISGHQGPIVTPISHIRVSGKGTRGHRFQTLAVRDWFYRQITEFYKTDPVSGVVLGCMSRCLR